MSAKSILKPLGKNGPLVPRLGFGLMGMSSTYGEIPSDEERFKLLDRAVELGETFWDTSDHYGDNEELLNKWFKRTGKRDQIFLATKYGYSDKTRKTLAVDSSYEYTKKSCDANLKALGVDVIDLYYIHAVNPETPIEETMRGLKELQDEGKIKHIGLSMVSSATLRRAVKIAPVAAVQTAYSVFDREVEGPAGSDLLAACRELGVALVVATPLGRGILTTDFSKGELASDDKDVRPKRLPQFLPENRDRNMRTVAEFRALSDRKGCTVAQLALAWLLKQGDDVFPIPGTRRVKYLEQNWAALDIALSDEEEREIREFAENAKLSGGALPEAFAGHRFRDTKELS
ncbi:putative aldo-keto reductase [Hypoxylon sp. FL1150]|nr:putative aldo-keto reductase [Hypoxylon sp. FL1150]